MLQLTSKDSLIDQNLIGIGHTWNAGNGLENLFSNEKGMN